MDKEWKKYQEVFDNIKYTFENKKILVICSEDMNLFSTMWFLCIYFRGFSKYIQDIKPNNPTDDVFIWDNFVISDSEDIFKNYYWDDEKYDKYTKIYFYRWSINDFESIYKDLLDVLDKNTYILWINSEEGRVEENQMYLWMRKKVIEEDKTNILNIIWESLIPFSFQENILDKHFQFLKETHFYWEYKKKGFDGKLSLKFWRVNESNFTDNKNYQFIKEGDLHVTKAPSYFLEDLYNILPSILEKDWIVYRIAIQKDHDGKYLFTWINETRSEYKWDKEDIVIFSKNDTFKECLMESYKIIFLKL